MVDYYISKQGFVKPITTFVLTRFQSDAFFTVIHLDLMYVLSTAIDLLEGMLVLDPEVRLTAKNGLSHPYISEFHDPENEPVSPAYDDSFESLDLAVSEWKSESVYINTHKTPSYLTFKMPSVLCQYV